MGGKFESAFVVIQGGWMERCRAWLVVAMIILSFVNSQDISACCDKASGSCRSVCEKMSLVEIATTSAMREERVDNIRKFCTSHLIEFWACMNQTIQEVVSGSDWWGRACCSVGRSAHCRAACARAGDDGGALSPACRRSDEMALYDCVQRQQEAQWCCSQTQSLSCNEACQKALWSSDQAQVDVEARERAVEVCEQSPILLQCMRDLTASTVHADTSKYLPCCHESTTPECRATCESVLKRTGEPQEIAAALAKDCGAPAIHDELWQCFLRKDAPADTKDIIPHDVGKLHCCFKATTINCRRLCFTTFNTGWQQNWQKFYSECLGDPQETELAQCIEEVDAPCSLGCSGLTYCSHLNNRPTQLFRACDARADLAAHMAVAEPKDSGMVKLMGMSLPLRNTSECTSDMWKSVACAMHVKPCTEKGHSSALCGAECSRLVSRCVRWSQSALAAPAPAPEHATAGGPPAPAPPPHSAAALCAALAPRTDHCVTLAPYSEPNPEPPLLSASEAISSPCSRSSCNRSQVCVVGRDCRDTRERCRKYTCLDGCSLGEGSDQTIPIGSWARVPMPSPSGKACFKLCKCSNRGLVTCQPLPCVPLERCRHRDSTVPHGSKYTVECNYCACAYGERVCSRRACDVSRLSGLPCNCPPHHLPVATPRATYPNACLAQCAGASDAEIEFGAAAAAGACGAASCGRRAACLPAPQLCLSRLQPNCDAHVCVNTTNCTSQPPNPVCDTSGKTHINPCHLVMGGRRFAYWGECLRSCSQAGQVCGLNGITYTSECAAWSELVSVDYLGPCLAVGPISNLMEPKCQFDRIVCPALKRPNCLGFTAPGACCPKCGGALRILYSKKQIDRALYGTNISASVVNLNNILRALERHVKIAECALRGYHTIESEIFISVETVVNEPTALQLKVCVLEAEKIADLINRESALMSSDLALSSLAFAIPIHTYPTNKASSINISVFILLVTCVMSYILS